MRLNASAFLVFGDVKLGQAAQGSLTSVAATTRFRVASLVTIILAMRQSDDASQQ
jgi:hypothetical protein